MNPTTRTRFPGIFCILLTLLPLVAAAQQDTTKRSIKGLVTAAKDGAAIANVSIRLKGSSQGTVTDENGQFNILAKPGDTLVVSAIGFRQLESPCGKNRMLRLAMPEDQKTMNEVMVVGYGNERKRNITGSISSISARELSKSSSLSFDNALIGKAAGVNILPSSGVPGAATAITIRGLSTLNPDGNHPLIVIDGIPVYGSGKNLNNRNFSSSTTPPLGFGGTSVSDNLNPAQEFENNPLASLNPADIESIEILKDAYATAIYGSRASAGVILVTTKKGSKTRPEFNIRFQTAAIRPIGNPDLLDGPQYNDLYTKYYKELGLNHVFESPYNTNWVDEVTRTAISRQADVSMAAGGDKARYFISGSYTDQPSYIINNDYKRYTGRVNLNYNASESFSMGINMWMSHAENSSMNAPQIYRAAIRKSPSLPVYNPDGSFAYGKGANPFGDMDANPVADALANINTLGSTEALGNLFLQLKPVRWLTFRSEIGTQLSFGEAFTRRVKRPGGYGDDAVESSNQNKKIVSNNTISLLHNRGDHYLNAIAGQSYEQSVESNTAIGGYGFFSDDINSITAAQNKYIKNALRQKWALVSYFGRLNYEWKNKYLAGVTYRVDGSSRFSRNRRYVGFPSFSAGWRLSEEDFLQNASWINDLKLRGSIGFTGNNNSTSYYGSQGQYLINSNNLSYAGIPIVEMQQPDNPNLKWERTRSVDIGLDASLLENRISITLDYYQRRIRDMILSSAVPRYQGWQVQPQNIGDMLNAGIELMMNADLINKKDVRWNTSFNISRNTNKILKLNFSGEEVGLANDAFKYMREGEAAGQFFLYDWIGVDPMTGNPLWNDNKGNISVIPPASRFTEVDDVNDFRRTYGTSMPEFYGGMGHNLGYRNWELHVFLSFSAGNKMINGTAANLLTYATEEAYNLGTDILNHWLVPGHETNIPKLANRSITPSPGSTGIRDFTTSRTNSRFLEDASYARVRTIRLAYRILPARLSGSWRKYLRSVELFASGTNLFTLTGYSGIDPEVNAFGSSALQSGYDELTLPQNKMIQIGFNIGL